MGKDNTAVGSDVAEPAAQVAGGTGAKARTRGLNFVRVTVLAIVCLAVAALIAGGYPKARLALRYQTWSKQGPRQAAERFCEAVRAGDADALRTAMVSPEQVIVAEDGTIGVCLGKGKQGKTVRADALRVDQSAADAPVRYDIAQELPSVTVTLDMPSGDCKLLVYVERVESGEWKVLSLRPDGPGMGKVMTQGI